MYFKCNSCNYKNNYNCCELCKKWFYTKKYENGFKVCSNCYIECEKMYIELINEQEKTKEKNNNYKNISEKYISLLIDFDGY